MKESYLEKWMQTSATFLDACHSSQKRRYNAYEPHCSGLYIGYSRLANDFLSFGASDKMGLDLSKSWEFGFNILSVYHNFKKNRIGESTWESAGDTVLSISTVTMPC
mgnify:CR=1 FL=1